MARSTWESLSYSGLFDPTSVATPVAWQKAEIAIIRLKINARNPIVGKTDLSKSIVREWSGYWYLYRDNYQIENGALDFKSEQIYFDRWLWNAEITTQQLAQRVPLIETTQPEENVEELSEFLVFGGEIIAGLVSNLNIPIVENVLQFIVDFFANLSSADLNYLPSPLRPDRLYVWVPAGLVDFDIEFHWLGYSPLAIGAGLAEIDIEDVQTLPILPQAENPQNQTPLINFDALARANGYILSGECPPVPNEEDVLNDVAENLELLNRYVLRYSIVQPNGTLVGNFERYLWADRNPLIEQKKVTAPSPTSILYLTGISYAPTGTKQFDMLSASNASLRPNLPPAIGVFSLAIAQGSNSAANYENIVVFPG